MARSKGSASPRLAKFVSVFMREKCSSDGLSSVLRTTPIEAGGIRDLKWSLEGVATDWSGAQRVGTVDASATESERSLFRRG
jgi:hypothetical protein